jgi:D-galactarolactone cycloisomerase
MKITKVETYLVSAPLAHSWETGIGSAKQRDELLVFVHTDEASARPVTPMPGSR